MSQYGIFVSKNFYDKSESFYKKILSESSPFLNNTSKVLDVGCGLGRLVFEYEKLGVKESFGIDSSRQFINFCRRIKNGKTNISYNIKQDSICRFEHEDILKSNLKNNSFNFISCINVVDRVNDPLLLLKQLHRILDKEGFLCLVTPYDWEFSHAPVGSRFDDIKQVLVVGEWQIEKELYDIPYTVPFSRKIDKTYNCHLLIVRKIA